MKRPCTPGNLLGPTAQPPTPLRLALKVVDAVCATIGRDRVGIRLSPFAGFNDAYDSTPYATFMYLVRWRGEGGVGHMAAGRRGEDGWELACICQELHPTLASYTPWLKAPPRLLPNVHLRRWRS